MFIISLMFIHTSASEKTESIPLLDNNQLNQVEEQTGSITINLEETDNQLSRQDVVFAIVKVADINKGLYELRDDLQDTGIDLNTIETAQELEAAAIALKNAAKSYDFSAKTNTDGTCIFENLEIGVYLIYPIDTADYEDISPFIIGIPTFSETDKVMKYDVTVLPKHAPHPTISILKVDKNDQTKVLKNAEFTLYDKNKQALQTVHTNENGIAQFYNIKDGTYYLKETKAPKGYQLSKDEIEVIIDEEYNSGHVYQVTVTNTLLPAITTGDTAAIGTIALTAATAFIGIIYFISKKKKDKNEDAENAESL